MNSVEKKPINMHFFQKILISIKDFEKYSLLMKESIGKTWLYIILLGFITSIALTLINIKPTLNRYEQLIAELKNNIQTLQYENDHLIVNDNSPTEVIHSDLFAGTLLIDTGEISEESLKQYHEDLKNEISMIALSDKLIFYDKINQKISEISYSEFKQTYKTEAFLAKLVFDNWSNQYNKTRTDATIIFLLLFYLFYNTMIDSVINAFLLGILCYVTAKILRLTITFSESFKIAIYSLTLPILLNFIYAIVKVLCDFRITYFELMYYGIAYIYILTALFMMKSDFTKSIPSLKKIKEVEEELEEKIQLKNEEKKQEKEKEDVEKRDRNSTQKKEKKKTRMKQKPEGSNA